MYYPFIAISTCMCSNKGTGLVNLMTKKKVIPLLIQKSIFKIPSFFFLIQAVSLVQYNRCHYVFDQFEILLLIHSQGTKTAQRPEMLGPQILAIIIHNVTWSFDHQAKKRSSLQMSSYVEPTQSFHFQTLKMMLT